MKNRHTSPFRWHLLVISAFIATMAIVAGCGNLQGTDVGSGGTGDVGSNQTHTDTGSGGTSDNGTALTLQSTMSRETNVSASGNEVAAVVLGNTTFALNALLRNPADTNTLFSPYSITTAFALLAPGTAGTTLYGIEQALSFPLAQNRFNPTLNKLEALLAAETNGAIMSNGASLPKLSTANAVWAQKDLTILTSYLDTLAVNYGAGVHIVDFAHASENSRLAINSWTSEATHEKIADLIPTGGIDAFTRFVLTNAKIGRASCRERV